jgi:hypothetical protein
VVLVVAAAVVAYLRFATTTGEPATPSDEAEASSGANP